jgi:UDP:flavonoid glycosyltransferase YjiC (YdhE family)
MLVVPSGADTAFWAARSRALGIAPAVVPHRHATVDALARAITALVRAVPSRDAVAALAAALRHERGDTEAALLIERLLLDRGS